MIGQLQRLIFEIYDAIYREHLVYQTLKETSANTASKFLPGTEGSELHMYCSGQLYGK